METKEIKLLIKRIIERKQDSSPETEDRDIDAMTGTRGWDVFKGRVEEMMLECLSPIVFQESTPLDVRGAVNEARAGILKTLKTIMEGVENAQSSEQIRREKEKEAQPEEKEEVSE